MFLTHFAGLPIERLAAEFGTPLYVYDASKIVERAGDLSRFDVVRFAQKACSNIAVLDLLRRRGVLVDAVSAGEVARALAAGYRPSEGDHLPGAHPPIVYTADVFDRPSLDLVAEHDLLVNCGSPDMIDQYGALCRRLGRRRGVTLRVNPGFGHGHSQKVNTGGEGSKHGVWHEGLDDCLARAERWGLAVTGLHIHIGSGADMEHLARVCRAMEEAALRVGPSVHSVSAGGGLPTPYRGDEAPIDLAAYHRLWDEARRRIAERFGHPVALEIEPGRYLTAESGALVAEVRAVKRMGAKQYCLVDAGFNNLARPAMYGAYHPIDLCPVGESADRPVEDFVVGGPLCESGDIFTQQAGGVVESRPLPRPEVGDLLVIGAAGAYGYSMASNYNSKPLGAEVLVEGGAPHLIRRAQTTDDLIRHESIPPRVD